MGKLKNNLFKIFASVSVSNELPIAALPIDFLPEVGLVNLNSPNGDISAEHKQFLG